MGQWADGANYAEFHNNLTAMPFSETIVEYCVLVDIERHWRDIIFFANILFAVNMFNTIILKPMPKSYC